LTTVTGDGLTKPSYQNSQFVKVVEGELLEIEKVRGINLVNIAGSEQYEYKGEILRDYTPILESNSLRHNSRGLLTRFVY